MRGSCRDTCRPSNSDARKTEVIFGIAADATDLELIVRTSRDAQAAGVRWTIEDFERVRRRVPVLCDLKPSGRFVAVDFHRAGGVPQVLKILLNHGVLHGECMTIHGRTLREMLKDVPDEPRADQEVIRSWSKPMYREGHLAILKGKEIVLFNIGGEFFALDNLCTHEEGPLCEGEIEGQITARARGLTLEQAFSYLFKGTSITYRQAADSAEKVSADIEAAGRRGLAIAADPRQVVADRLPLSGGCHVAEHDDGLAPGHPLERGGGDAVPVEGRDGDHDHHGDEGGHRDGADEVTEADDQDQQEHPGEEGRDPGAGARRLHVDHRLADHRAAAHAAEEAGDDVRRTLAPCLAALVGVGVGDVVDQLRGQQRLEEAHESHRQCIGGDDAERLRRERDVGNQERGQAVRLGADLRSRGEELQQIGQEQRLGVQAVGGGRPGDVVHDTNWPALLFLPPIPALHHPLSFTPAPGGEHPASL